MLTLKLYFFNFFIQKQKNSAWIYKNTIKTLIKKMTIYSIKINKKYKIFLLIGFLYLMVAKRFKK